MKVNVLIDGGFLEQALKKQQKQISIAEVDTIVKQAVTSLQTKFGTVVSVNLFRVLYYDCFPFEGKKKDPNGNTVDFASKPIVPAKKAFFGRYR